MPTYDYECTACGYTFEKFQSIIANPLRACPECKLRKVKRLIGAGAGIIFKGSGFYQTDYRSDSYRKAAEKEKKSDSKKTNEPDKSAKQTSEVSYKKES